MATANPLGVAGPTSERLARGSSAVAVAPGAGAPRALIPVPKPEEAGEEMEFGAPVVKLPVELDVAVPVREFRVRHLLALTPGQLIESQWGHGSDVPLAAGDVQLAWSEFEVLETKLAVRVTRLL